MRIGLIGFGYWGKILHKNLVSMKHEVIVCDTLDHPSELNMVRNYADLSVDAAFVAVPCKQHYDICKHFLSKRIPVFCEKPLAFTLEESRQLYTLASETNTPLFVDWVFIYNQQVNRIKDICESSNLGRMKSVSMRRLNKGPVRYDVDSLYDLSSHDLSILLHVIGVHSQVNKICSQHYRANKHSVQSDSFFGVYEVGDVVCTLHSSWEHPTKDRGCVFEFERGIVSWDDITQTLAVDGKPIFFDEKELPLVNSINSFLHTNSDQLAYQRQLTLRVMEILNNEIQ